MDNIFAVCDYYMDSVNGVPAPHSTTAWEEGEVGLERTFWSLNNRGSGSGLFKTGCGQGSELASESASVLLHCLINVLCESHTSPLSNQRIM